MIIKKVPIGISDFKELIKGDYYFTDKSLLIKEFIDNNSKIILTPRPRRFGKTLNLSMLKYFFDIDNKQENLMLFKGLLIENEIDIMFSQGKYPVIYLSFKNEKYSTWEELQKSISRLMSEIYIDYSYCIDNDKLLPIEKEYYNNIVNIQGDSVDLAESLRKLSKFLHSYYGKRIIILIDEYDIPIQEGYINGYYGEVIEFMRNFLGRALKDNIYVEKAMLTGILRVAKESIFSGLNNLGVFTLINYDFADKFGFTEDEVQKLLNDYDFDKTKLELIKGWYNGYNFGDKIIYNPWSVLNYIDKPKEGLKPYWINTSSNDLIKLLLTKGGENIKIDLENLIRGEEIEKTIDDNIVMGEIDDSSENLWSFLLLSGYLKTTEKRLEMGELICKLKIPNLEVKTLYKSIIEKWLKDNIKNDKHELMLRSLVNGDIKTFEKFFKQFVLNSMSYFDVGGNEGEKVYHAFVLGMLIALNNTHEIKSNGESGYGRYDVMIIPRDITKLGIIIEFKKLDEDDYEDLEETANEALSQIEKRQYKSALIERGVNDVIEVGIVFKGKNVLVKKQKV